MCNLEAISKYRIMWLLVFFDLPTDTKRDRRNASKFRKNLLADGFGMFQFSIYIRHCSSYDNANVHIKRVKSFLPPKGHVVILKITDAQFAMMQIFYGKEPTPKPKVPQQLELF